MTRLFTSPFTCRLLIAFALLLAPTSYALAQKADMNIADQPGYVPNASDEELPPEYQRQMVLYRTTEPPGTIIS